MDAFGCAIDEAVADACARGYAEADPSADLDGRDAAAKLAILCALAFGLRVAARRTSRRAARRSLLPDDFLKARQRGGTIRQIAHAEFTTRSVEPDGVGRADLRAGGVGVRADDRPAECRGHHRRVCGGDRVERSGRRRRRHGGGRARRSVAIARDRAAIVPAPVLREPAEIRGLSDHKLAEAV